VSKKCPLSACAAEHRELTIRNRLLEVKVSLLEKVALLADRAAWGVSCFEHADNCCKEWCQKCQEAEALGDELARALSRCDWLKPEEDEDDWLKPEEDEDD
jgi:hypothetical protein